VAENIAYPLRLRKSPPHSMDTKIQSIMQQLQITALASRYPQQLSGGEQRRVMLARTLVYDPRILLFDEPFAGVDALLRFDLVQQLKPLLVARAVPILYVTHDLAEAQFLSTQSIVLRDGKVTAQGSWITLTQQARSATAKWLNQFLHQRFA
jgi:iron(III) transport system ATP-binding protein